MTWGAVAVAGATGAVGREMLKMLDTLDFPIGELRLLASSRSAGKKLKIPIIAKGSPLLKKKKKTGTIS